MIVKVIVIILFIILFWLLFRRWTDSMVFFPQKAREQYSATPNQIGAEYDDLWFQSGKEKIHGWLIKSDSSYSSDSSDIPIILFFHGNAGHLAHRLSLLARLRLTGAHILIVSYRGYGLSSGKST